MYKKVQTTMSRGQSVEAEDILNVSFEVTKGYAVAIHGKVKKQSSNSASMYNI